jgi:hypothetical protein
MTSCVKSMAISGLSGEVSVEKDQCLLWCSDSAAFRVSLSDNASSPFKQSGRGLPLYDAVKR